MKFKTVAEAFNYYKGYSTEDIDKRVVEIGKTIDTDPKADIEGLNIELEGLKQAKANVEERSQNLGTGNRFNPITGMNFNNNQNKVPEGDIFSSAEYRSAFYKNLLGQKLTEVEGTTYTRAMDIVETERRADAFNTTTNSAAVLPTQTLNEIIKKARTMGGLIPNCRNFNIPSNLSVPIGTPSNKANWHVEGVGVESEKVAPTNVIFGAYEIIKIFSMSAAAKKMSIQAFEAYIIDELNNCVMECIADSLVNGTGSGQGTGLITGITWTDKINSFTFDKALGLKYQDLTGLVAKLKRGYGAGAKWAMNNSTLYNQVYGLIDTTGRPIFIADPKNEEIGYILGKPVVIDDNLADDAILLGDFKYMGYNIPQGIMVEMSTQSSFKSGLVDYRAMAIADTKPLVAEAFLKLSRATV